MSSKQYAIEITKERRRQLEEVDHKFKTFMKHRVEILAAHRENCLKQALKTKMKRKVVKNLISLIKALSYVKKAAANRDFKIKRR